MDQSLSPNSFSTPTKTQETKTVLKLLNQYAEGYHVLEQEKKLLQSEIKDLQTNLKLNKDIISSFLSKKSFKEETKSLITNLQTEIKNLYSTLSTLRNENSNLISKQTLLQNEINSLHFLLDKKENQTFVLEQSLIKNENIIQSYKKKYNNNKINPSKYLIIEPSQAIVKLNDELLTYKDIYKKVTKYLKRNCEKINKYEHIITDLQTENGRLRTQNKMQIYSANREKENLLYKLREEFYLNNKSTPNRNSDNTNKVNNNNNLNNKTNININSNNRRGKRSLLIASNFEDKIVRKLEMKTNKENMNQNSENEYTNRTPPVYRDSFKDDEDDDESEEQYENEEFEDVLKMAGISIDNFILMSKNKIFSKLTDAIEFMFKLVSEKNMCIHILELENENLNAKNYQLNKENIELMNEHKKRTGLGDSMINNTSQITINNLNIHTTPRKNDNENISKRKNSLLSGDNCDKNTKDSSSNNKGLTSNNNINVNNRQVLTLESITSSEFKQECVQFQSFASINEDQFITLEQNKIEDEQK